MKHDNSSSHQAFGFLIFLVGLFGCICIAGGSDLNTLTIGQSIRTIIPMLFILGVGVLIYNLDPAKVKELHSNKKARKVGKPNRANEKL